MREISHTRLNCELYECQNSLNFFSCQCPTAAVALAKSWRNPWQLVSAFSLVLRNVILHFAFRLGRSLEIVPNSPNLRTWKHDFSAKDLRVKKCSLPKINFSFILCIHELFQFKSDCSRNWSKNCSKKATTTRHLRWRSLHPILDWCYSLVDRLIRSICSIRTTRTFLRSHNLSFYR